MQLEYDAGGIRCEVGYFLKNSAFMDSTFWLGVCTTLVMTPITVHKWSLPIFNPPKKLETSDTPIHSTKLTREPKNESLENDTCLLKWLMFRLYC